MTLFYAALIGGLLFSFGYYLGNQIGRTEHIRVRLHTARQHRKSL